MINEKNKAFLARFGTQNHLDSICAEKDHESNILTSICKNPSTQSHHFKQIKIEKRDQEAKDESPWGDKTDTSSVLPYKKHPNYKP